MRLAILAWLKTLVLRTKAKKPKGSSYPMR